MGMVVFCVFLVSLVSQPPQIATFPDTTVFGAITGLVGQRHETITGEIYISVMCGAQVFVSDSSNTIGTTTDSEGEYLLRLPPGVYTLEFKMVGMADDSVENVEVTGLPCLTSVEDAKRLATRIDVFLIPQALGAYHIRVDIPQE